MFVTRRRFVGMTAGILATPANCSEPSHVPLRPEDFGANGKGDDTVAIQRLADQAAYLRRTIDGGNATYRVDNVVWPSGTRLSNIRLILNPGDRDDRSPVAIGRRGQVTRDLVFDNVMIDGNRAQQERVGASGYADGARSGFQIKGAVENVTIRNSRAINCATDGVMIFSDLQHGRDDRPILRDITLANVVSIGNRRHGLSADAFHNLCITGCRLGQNGRDLAGAGPIDHGRTGTRFNGAPYGRPFDIEDYLVGTGWSGLTIEDTDCTDNCTGALIYSPVSPESSGFVARRGVKIARCRFNEPGGSRWDPPLGIAQSLDYHGTRATFCDIQLIDNIFDNGPLRVSGVDGLVMRGGQVRITKKNETEPLIQANCSNVRVDVNDLSWRAPAQPPTH